MKKTNNNEPLFNIKFTVLYSFIPVTKKSFIYNVGWYLIIYYSLFHGKVH